MDVVSRALQECAAVRRTVALLLMSTYCVAWHALGAQVHTATHCVLINSHAPKVPCPAAHPRYFVKCRGERTPMGWPHTTAGSPVRASHR